MKKYYLIILSSCFLTPSYSIDIEDQRHREPSAGQFHKHQDMTPPIPATKHFPDNEAIKIIKSEILMLKEDKESLEKLHSSPQSKETKSSIGIYIQEYNARIKELEALLSHSPLTLKIAIQEIDRIDRKYHPQDDM